MSIVELMADNKVTMTFQFVPWSKSRNFKANAKISDMSLNWVVSVFVNGRHVLTTDYSAGIAHCPGYKFGGGRMKYETAKVVEFECEHGKVGRWVTEGHIKASIMKKPITPDPSHIMESLLLDSEVINYGGFEDWADSFGYDKDSRKAEAIYKSCLDTGLKMSAGFGPKLLLALTKAGTQDTISCLSE